MHNNNMHIVNHLSLFRLIILMQLLKLKYHNQIHIKQFMKNT